MLKSIGSDMEVLAENKDGHAVALCGKIGGTKENPQQIEGLSYGFMVQEDNVALEFNIPPCTSMAGFVQSMEIMRLVTKKKLAALDLIMSKNSCLSFDKKELTHPSAIVFGCEPDYNAWTREMNPKPESKDMSLRTAGGHIHVGTEEDIADTVKMMDLLLGVPSVILDDSPAALRRKELYGKAGALRPKSYGFEYRSLSNFWMFDNKLVEWVYKQTKLACDSELRKPRFNAINKEDSLNIQNCINTGNKEIAKHLINKYNISMV